MDETHQKPLSIANKLCKLGLKNYRCANSKHVDILIKFDVNFAPTNNYDNIRERRGTHSLTIDLLNFV